MEATCNRLSAFLSRNDERLRPILCPETSQGSSDAASDAGSSDAGSTAAAADAVSAASKARFLAGLYAAELPAERSGSRGPPRPPDPESIRAKKLELIESLSEKLGILVEEEGFLEQEWSSNETLAEAVMGAVGKVGGATGETKLRGVWSDAGRLRKLEGNLGSQLGRVEKALCKLGGGVGDEEEEAERRLLSERAVRLSRQLSDAESLGKGLSSRRLGSEELVSALLGEEKAEDWRFALDAQARLIKDRRQIDDKLQLGREQIAALHASLS